MPRRRFFSVRGVMLLWLAVCLSGCDDDKRLVEVSREAAERQAEQNRQIASQSQQTAEATKELVAADAQARQELTALQQNLRADQAEIGKQRDALEVERQAIAATRNGDRLWAPVFRDLGIFGVIVAALAFCGYLLRGLQQEVSTEAAVEELLIEELVAENPRLLPARPAAPVLDYHPQGDSADPEAGSTVPPT